MRREAGTSRNAPQRSGKETDLIYEGIATLLPIPIKLRLFLKETDLIYEGIATLHTKSISKTTLVKETDLIYEGIATLHTKSISKTTLVKETDLIYEGIATRSIDIPESIPLPDGKKLTWFTKGLRRHDNVPPFVF